MSILFQSANSHISTPTHAQSTVTTEFHFEELPQDALSQIDVLEALHVKVNWIK